MTSKTDRHKQLTGLSNKLNEVNKYMASKQHIERSKDIAYINDDDKSEST